MDPSDYTYDEDGNVTNCEPVVDQPDFRSYPPYTFTEKGETYTLRLCCNRIGGRWEYFISGGRTK